MQTLDIKYIKPQIQKSGHETMLKPQRVRLLVFKNFVEAAAVHKSTGQSNVHDVGKHQRSVANTRSDRSDQAQKAQALHFADFQICEMYELAAAVNKQELPKTMLKRMHAQLYKMIGRSAHEAGLRETYDLPIILSWRVGRKLLFALPEPCLKAGEACCRR